MDAGAPARRRRAPRRLEPGILFRSIFRSENASDFSERANRIHIFRQHDYSHMTHSNSIFYPTIFSFSSEIAFSVAYSSAKQFWSFLSSSSIACARKKLILFDMGREVWPSADVMEFMGTPLGILFAAMNLGCAGAIDLFIIAFAFCKGFSWFFISALLHVSNVSAFS